MSAQFEDLLCYEKTSYAVIEQAPLKCFEPENYGLKPDGGLCSACARGFWCDFSVIEGRLLLSDLHIETENGIFPPIGSVAVRFQKEGASTSMGFPVYENLNIPVLYTGKFLAGDGYLNKYGSFYGAPSWSYENLKEFVFENGLLREVNDLSELGEKLRNKAPAHNFLDLWPDKKEAFEILGTEVWWI